MMPLAARAFDVIKNRIGIFLFAWNKNGFTRMGTFIHVFARKPVNTVKIYLSRHDPACVFHPGNLLKVSVFKALAVDGIWDVSLQ
jgi:hypothetical protein